MLIKLLYFQCFVQSHRHNFIEQELSLKYTEEEDDAENDQGEKENKPTLAGRGGKKHKCNECAYSSPR